MRLLTLVHCFDHNYVLPAAVAFRSLLEHARRPEAVYALKVIGSGLTDEDRSLLSGVVASFPQATLDFIQPPPLDEKLKRAVAARSWSPDLLYKLAIPDLLSDVDVALVADVDVVYADDVAETFDRLRSGDDVYVAAGRDLAYARWRGEGLYPDRKKKMRGYFKLYSEEERARLMLNAGLMVFNCLKMRRDGIPARWRAWALANARRLILPEQDVISQVCHPKVRALPWNHMAVAPAFADYERMDAAARAANPTWDAMFTHPVQIHYVSSVKPWKYPDSPMAGLWFDACIRAGLFDRWRAWYGDFMRIRAEESQARKLLGMRFRLGRNRFALRLVSWREDAHG